MDRFVPFDEARSVQCIATHVHTGRRCFSPAFRPLARCFCTVRTVFDALALVFLLSSRRRSILPTGGRPAGRLTAVPLVK